MTTKYSVTEDFEALNHIDIVKRWSFSETVVGISIVLTIYFWLVVKVLPDFMKNRQPYKLKNLLMVYNVCQVALSLYLTSIYTIYIIKHGIMTTRCPKGEALKEVVFQIYPYFIAKHLDLLDTVIFVLRKKDNQITFLHLYHHATMAIWMWFYLMYYPTDHFVVVGLLNSLVHVFMYTYYGISALGPGYEKFLWWKKHLTKIQLVQFVLVLANLHYQQKLTPCPIPELFHYYCITLICSFFVLFMKFYLMSYKQKRNKNTIKDTSRRELNSINQKCN